MKNTKTLTFSLFLIIASLVVFTSDVKAVYYGEFGEPIKDTFVSSNLPSNNFGTQVSLHTGYNIGYKRIFVEWNTTDAELGDYVYMAFDGKFEQSIAYANYVNFYLYEIDEDWNETEITWSDQPDLRERFDTINATVHANSAEFILYLDITDSWNDFVGSSFADYYGYCVIMEKISDYSYFECDSREGVSSPYLYFSQFELDSDGNPIGTGSTSTSDTSEEMIDFIKVFLFVGAPALMGGSATRSIQGFLFGACVGIGAGVMAGFIPYWFLFLLVLALLALIMNIGRGGRG